MLTQEENTRLTRVGPGTPMGELLRRYWHPIAATVEMREAWTKRVRLLGEDLVLYRDRSGRFGLIEEFCPHRRASLAYGIPTDNGIRCAYHGWAFDATGTCIEQPNEPEGSTFREKVQAKSYLVEELGGMLWAYLGPLPAPLVPRLDGFVVAGAVRTIGQYVVPCNWLQIMENSLDPVHTEWLHGKLYEFLHEDEGAKVAISRHHEKIAFDEHDYGIVKRRLLAGQSEESDDWKVGHPVVFPTILSVGSAGGEWTNFNFQIRVPIDDTHTQHYWYFAYIPPVSDVPQALLDEVTLYDVQIKDERGVYRADNVDSQDVMIWVSQGEIFDRSTEHLGSTDRGVTIYRKMLEREIKNVEAGREPMFVLRDPEKNDYIALPLERGKDMYGDGFASFLMRTAAAYSPVAPALIELFSQKPRAETLV